MSANKALQKFVEQFLRFAFNDPTGFEREKRAQADEMRKQNQERRRQNEEIRRAAAAQHRENQENRREADSKLTNAIKNEKLLQEQFNTARAAVAFEQLNERQLAA